MRRETVPPTPFSPRNGPGTDICGPLLFDGAPGKRFSSVPAAISLLWRRSAREGLGMKSPSSRPSFCGRTPKTTNAGNAVPSYGSRFASRNSPSMGWRRPPAAASGQRLAASALSTEIFCGPMEPKPGRPRCWRHYRNFPKTLNCSITLPMAAGAFPSAPLSKGR